MAKDDMKKWIEQRSVKLLLAVNAVPYDDDHDAKQLKMIRDAFKEVMAEIMRRTIERTRSDWEEMDQRD